MQETWDQGWTKCSHGLSTKLNKKNYLDQSASVWTKGLCSAPNVENHREPPKTSFSGLGPDAGNLGSRLDQVQPWSIDQTEQEKLSGPKRKCLHQGSVQCAKRRKSQGTTQNVIFGARSRCRKLGIKVGPSAAMVYRPN